MDDRNKVFDEEVAVESLTEYTLGNNRASQVALTGSYERIIVDSNTQKLAEMSIRNVYGVNLFTIANYLSTQDLFFNKIMPHWLSYLDSLGISAQCIAIKTSDIAVNGLISQYMRNPNQEALSSFDPNKKWTDLRYMMNDPKKNVVNPLNIFFKVYLRINHAEKYLDFVKAVNNLYHCENMIKTDTFRYDINCLPAPDDSMMMKVTRLMHKYL